MNTPARKSSLAQRQVYMYGIKDETGAVRYVGKSVDVERRFKDHLSEQHRAYPLYTWLRKQQREGRAVSCEVLAVATTPDWQSLEKALISQYRAEGQRLLNLADGGDEPFVTLEQRRLNGARIRCPLEVRQNNGRKVSAAIQADPRRAELHRIKLMLSREWVRGNLHSAVKDKLVNLALLHPQQLWCFMKLAAKHG